jgi:hypothetical protein
MRLHFSTFLSLCEKSLKVAINNVARFSFSRMILKIKHISRKMFEAENNTMSPYAFTHLLLQINLIRLFPAILANFKHCLISEYDYAGIKVGCNYIASTLR